VAKQNIWTHLDPTSSDLWGLRSNEKTSFVSQSCPIFGVGGRNTSTDYLLASSSRQQVSSTTVEPGTRYNCWYLHHTLCTVCMGCFQGTRICSNVALGFHDPWNEATPTKFISSSSQVSGSAASRRGTNKFYIQAWDDDDGTIITIYLQ